MKKKSLILPISLAALMLVAGCNSNESSDVQSSSETPSESSLVESSSLESSATSESTSTVSATVAIENLDDVQNNFFAGDSKDLVIVGDPAIESIFDALDAGELKIQSSDSEIVVVTNFTLKALKAGKVTITVTYLDAQTSFDITVKAEKTAIDLYGTVHAGTEDDPLNTADAVKVSDAVGTDKSTAYYIQGTINAFYHFPGENDAYTSFFFAPEGEGDRSFEAYKISMPGDPQVGVPTDYAFPGAEVVVKGRITTYSGQAETDTGEFVRLVSGTKPEMQTITGKTLAEVITASKAGVDGDVTYNSYTLCGYVQAISGKNYFLGDEKLGDGETPNTTNLFEIYNYDLETLGLAEGSVDDKILVGSKVELTCHVKRYHDQVEGVVLTGLVKVIEKGVVVEATKATVTEALAIGYALEGGQVSATTYEITGVVCKRGSWNSSYGNGDLYIAESADEVDASKMIQLYRVNDQAIFDASRVGDTICVLSNLQRYIQKDKTTQEVIKDVVETAEGPKVSLVKIHRDFAETLAIGQTLENGQVTSYTVVFNAYITDLGTWSDKYGNVDITVSDSKEGTSIIKVYRYTDQTTYNTLAVGDYLTIEAPLTRYIKTDKTTGEVVQDVVETAEKVSVLTKTDAPAAAVNGVPGETTVLDLVNTAEKFGFTTWNTSYSERTILSSDLDASFPGVKIDFKAANKSASSVTDCPVTKNSDVTITILGTVGVKSVKVTFKQWGTKVQSVKAMSGDTELLAETAISFTDSVGSVTVTSESALSVITFSTTKSNQVGWASFELTF